ncbi:MAG: CHRD domain-containing protein [Hyphomicrobium sp.]
MTATGIRAGIFVLAAVIFAVSGSAAVAERLTFKADLKGIEGTESKAHGRLTAEYDTDTRKLTWRGSYGGLGTYATAAGIHGPSSGIVVKLRDINSPFDGTAILSDKQASDLIAGRWFVLVRTADHPEGELRGQIEPAN